MHQNRGGDLEFVNKLMNHRTNKIPIIIYIYISLFEFYRSLFEFYRYIENIDGYFDKNINKIKINKNILKFMKILC